MYDCRPRECVDEFKAFIRGGGGNDWCERDGKGTEVLYLLAPVRTAVLPYGERGWLCLDAWVVAPDVFWREEYVCPIRSSASSSSIEFMDSPSILGWLSSFRVGGNATCSEGVSGLNKIGERKREAMGRFSSDSRGVSE